MFLNRDNIDLIKTLRDVVARQGLVIAQSNSRANQAGDGDAEGDGDGHSRVSEILG